MARKPAKELNSSPKSPQSSSKSKSGVRPSSPVSRPSSPKSPRTELRPKLGVAIPPSPESGPLSPKSPRNGSKPRSLSSSDSGLSSLKLLQVVSKLKSNGTPSSPDFRPSSPKSLRMVSKPSSPDSGLLSREGASSPALRSDATPLSPRSEGGCLPRSICSPKSGPGVLASSPKRYKRACSKGNSSASSPKLSHVASPVGNSPKPFGVTSPLAHSPKSSAFTGQVGSSAVNNKVALSPKLEAALTPSFVKAMSPHAGMAYLGSDPPADLSMIPLSDGLVTPSSEASTPSRTPTSMEFDVDDMIRVLLEVDDDDRRLCERVDVEDLILLCTLAKKVFAETSCLVEINPPVIVCGDLHGQYADLLRIYDANGFPPESNYLFLGDYVDRGHQSIETIALQLCYQIKYPKNFILLRGNHETDLVNRVYGFYEECTRRFASPALWMAFQAAFDYMPMSALVGGRMLCMHGGISPFLKSINQLKSIQRPATLNPPCLESDLLWSDPNELTIGYAHNGRGSSFTFGPDAVKSTCSALDIDLIVRGHQVVQDGYEFFAKRRLVTIFSAPHYCGEFDNCAASMSVSEDMVCSLKVYSVRRPAKVKIKKAPISFLKMMFTKLKDFFSVFRTPEETFD